MGHGLASLQRACGRARRRDPARSPASSDPTAGRRHMDKQFGRSVWPEPVDGASRPSRGIVMPGADEIRGFRERDKLTIAEVCADLGISRRMFYEWRMKNRAPRCITLPNGSLRIRRSEYQRWLASREEAA